jgi:RNA polymerase sigma-54 factor
MAAIARHQQQFFVTGDELDLQPLTQQTIAQQTGYDVSTISRTISNKYVQTNFGILPLKYFFVTKMVNTDGDDVSVQQIKNALTEIILGEDKKNPLTDEEISALLYQKGFKTARRTVAKYRSQLGIATTQMRKET